MFEEIHDPAARVRALCEFGCQVAIDKSVAPKHYFRSGIEMLRMATVYHEEGNLEAAFILYSKFITLFIEKLPSHPLYKTSDTIALQNNKKKLKQVFPIAEKLKKNLTDRYTAEENKRLEFERKQQEEINKEQERLRKLEEQRRLDEAAIADQLKKESEERWLRAQEARYRELQEQGKQGPNAPTLGTGPLVDLGADIAPAPPDYFYAVSPSSDSKPSSLQPSPPTVPDRELKKNVLSVSPTTPPSVDRSTKPPSINHLTSIGSSSDNAYGLRTVMVPKQLMDKFLKIAESNTLANIETCGILAGKISQNAFHITHVLIPKQTGTADTCTTAQEEDLFEYQDNHSLITLGWIHTHPSQTAFLSSVDLHTHCSYQIMMPEAIAIVCSPKYNDTGIFMLTPERGLPLISSCREAGFHMHPKDPPLFETCEHVRLIDNPGVIIADLRTK